jgi:hypothetical protein
LFLSRGFATGEGSCFLLGPLLLDLDVLELYSRNSKPISFLFFLLYSFGFFLIVLKLIGYILEFLKKYLIIQIVKILSWIKKNLRGKNKYYT